MRVADDANDSRCIAAGFVHRGNPMREQMQGLIRGGILTLRRVRTIPVSPKWLQLSARIQQSRQLVPVQAAGKAYPRRRRWT